MAIAAQPGDEAQQLERTVANLKALDEKIARKPNDADLHFQRGSLYLGLFGAHREVAEFGGIVYVNDPGGKAILDLDRAIELDQSKSKYYTGRGKFYDLQWGHAVSRGSEVAASSWEKIRLLLWDNRSFDSAVKDYQKAFVHCPQRLWKCPVR
jgi:tetratricopeptide (TPR) repeat protein